MLYSMTGFGQAQMELEGKEIRIEIRSVNGKQFDCKLSIPYSLKHIEADIKTYLQQKLFRGTVHCSITIDHQKTTTAYPQLNVELIKSYYATIQNLSEELHIDNIAILNAILRLPDIVQMNVEEKPVYQMVDIEQGLATAITLLLNYRMAEGENLKKDLLDRINHIKAYQHQINEIEPVRRTHLKTKLEKSLTDWTSSAHIDTNRLEQELIYYIEKMDITEEDTRLTNHCNYFVKEINALTDPNKGRKLGFILQEIGREINTMGAKANHFEMQHVVVKMKDELEKAKEQILNIL